VDKYERFIEERKVLVSDYFEDTIEATLYNCDACCFDAGTQILMADKTLKAIEDITAGEHVISYNIETGSFEEDVVTKTIIKPNSDDLVFIKLSDGTKLGMRAYHPLLTVDGWKSLRPALAETIADIKEPIALLNIGDTVVTIDGTATIIEIITREDILNYNTYNLTVAKNHNYFANGVVAHNAGCPV
jgi:intein/homing endonuclease